MERAEIDRLMKIGRETNVNYQARKLEGADPFPKVPELPDTSCTIDGQYFKTKPYDHQLEAFNRFKDNSYFALFMDMGTGKSKTAIDIASYKFQRGEINGVLIIAPNHVHTQWVKEQYPIHCSIPYIAFEWISGKHGTRWFQGQLDSFMGMPSEKLKVLSVNVEAFQAKSILPHIARFVKNHEVFTIVDEATRIKTPTATRSRNIHKINKYGQRCILTGTPTAKSPFDLWSMFEFLKRDYFECNHFVFQHRYGIIMKGMNYQTGTKFNTLLDEKTYHIMKAKIRDLKEKRGGELMPNDYEMLSTINGISEKNIHWLEDMKKYAKFKRLDELKELISKDVFSVRKEDCLDLPPKVYERVIVDMSKEQKRIYNNLKNELIAMYEGQELSVQNKIALTTRLMQICGGFFPYEETDGKRAIKPIAKNPKIAQLLAEIDEIGEDEPIIIWAQFVAELQEIYNTLQSEHSCGLYYGATSSASRKEIIEKFKSGEIRIFIGNPTTAGFGLNFQHANIQLFYSNSFRTEIRLQSEDRTHRIGNKGTCLYKDIVLKGSIDEKVYRVISEGRDLNDFFKSKGLRELLDDEE